MEPKTEIPIPYYGKLVPEIPTKLLQFFRGGERIWENAWSAIKNMDQFSKQQLQRSVLTLSLTALGATAVTLDHSSLQAEFILPPTQASSIRVEAKPNTISTNTTEDKLFKNFTPLEKAVTEKEIAEQVKLYKDAGDNLRVERVLDWEKTTVKPILDLDVPAKDRRFWKELLSAIVYVESEGKHLAESEAGAIGLAQWTEATAKETAARHGILNFDLKKGWDNLRLSRFLLEDLRERYGPDIFLLGYYAGQNFTDKQILDQQLRSSIEQLRINIFNLGSDDGMEYFTKIVAAMRILKEARTG